MWPAVLVGRSFAAPLAGLATALALILFAPTPAPAAPPNNADPALADWFRSLRQPGSGISCCSEADCRVTTYRTNGNGYEALIDGDWRPVPPDKVLQHISNPVGRAVVCYTPRLGILCFVRPAET